MIIVGRLCNGSTRAFGARCSGSNPDLPANIDAQANNECLTD